MIAVGNCKLQNGIWVHEIVRQIQIEQLCNYDKNIAKSCLSCIITLSMLGWSGVVKLSCILRHRDVQLILAYSWARFGILVAGEGRGGECFYFFCFFTFTLIPLSSLSLSSIASISFLPFSARRHKMIHKGWRVVKPKHNQSKIKMPCPLQIFSHSDYLIQAVDTNSHT